MKMNPNEAPKVVPNQINSFPYWNRQGKNKEKRKMKDQLQTESINSNNNQTESWSHLVDAFVCEPIPYRTAINDNCTHIGLIF